MNDLAYHPDLSGKYNTNLKQDPDNYIFSRTNRNIQNELAADGIQIQNANAVSKQASESVGQLETKRVVPPVDRCDWDQRNARKVRTLHPIAEWEGFVESITADEFSVRMVNVRSNSLLPTDQTTFNRNNVSDYDQQLLRVGAIVRWVVGRERLPTGQVRNVSELYFRRLPAHSEKDFIRAHNKAEKLLEMIVWEDEAES